MCGQRLLKTLADMRKKALEFWLLILIFILIHWCAILIIYICSHDNKLKDVFFGSIGFLSHVPHNIYAPFKAYTWCCTLHALIVWLLQLSQVLIFVYTIFVSNFPKQLIAEFCKKCIQIRFQNVYIY